MPVYGHLFSFGYDKNPKPHVNSMLKPTIICTPLHDEESPNAGGPDDALDAAYQDIKGLHHLCTSLCVADDILHVGPRSSDDYRVPPFTLKPELQLQPDPLRPVETQEFAKKRRARRFHFTKHTRSKPVLDGSLRDFNAMMKKIQRRHRRRKNRAFVSQQFDDILEDLFDGIGSSP